MRTAAEPEDQDADTGRGQSPRGPVSVSSSVENARWQARLVEIHRPSTEGSAAGEREAFCVSSAETRTADELPKVH